ncbi:hypothetical protein ACMHYB_62245 [Sorangium sp. So ce1128]
MGELGMMWSKRAFLGGALVLGLSAGGLACAAKESSEASQDQTVSLTVSRGSPAVATVGAARAGAAAPEPVRAPAAPGDDMNPQKGAPGTGARLPPAAPAAAPPPPPPRPRGTTARARPRRPPRSPPSIRTAASRRPTAPAAVTSRPSSRPSRAASSRPPSASS